MGHERDRSSGRTRPDGSERREPPTRPPAEDTVLALQRSAGNQAVSALLARSPETAKAEEKGAPVSGPRATLAGIGTIALLSFNLPASGPGPSGGTGGQGKAKSPEEIVFSSHVGDHSAKLLRAALDGKAMEVEVVLPNRRLKLTGAIVSNYTTSGQDERAIESWTLNFRSIDQTAEGEASE